MSDTTSRRTTVRFGRRQTRGLLLGFSAPRIAAVAVIVVVLVIAVVSFGGFGVLLTSPLLACLLASVFLQWHGRPAVEMLPIGLHYGARHAVGQTTFRAQVSLPRPPATMALPGDTAALRFHLDQPSGAVMVHDPHASTLSAIAHVTHPAFILLSPDEQTQRVAAWGRLLAGLASSDTCTRIQVLETTHADSGRGITGWWQDNGSGDEPEWAVREYQELMRTAAPSAATHRTLVTFVLDLRRAAKAVKAAGGGTTGSAEVLRQHMSDWEASLRAADLTLAGWLSAEQLAGVIREAYDPAGADRICELDIGRDLATAGPLAVREQWDRLQHDSGYSCVLWISEWPRVDVAPSFLHTLVFEPGVRKSFSLVATPLSTVRAMRDIRRQKVEYVADAAQKANLGQLADLSDLQEYHDVLDREQALIAGHADIRFSGFVAVTASTNDGLDAAVAQLQRAISQCGCEARLLYGQQAQSFTVAALPLGRKAQ